MKILTLSVFQFNNFVKNILASEEFLNGIAIYGEVTNFKVSGGNAYFDLKDENAMLSCVKFDASDLILKNGDLITVYGKINFYVKSGRLNFIVQRTETSGLGELYQKFLQLKEKLEKEGFFREELKKPIPKFAKRIGVVTSETGAVIRDIIHVTKLKNPYTDIVVYPSKVQGFGAEDDVSSGVNYFNTRDDIDVIIVARGGGSMEDLAPFNTEKVVKTIFNSKIPVISAVGHETDFTLCDFVSDLRVPTPSVAAEVAVFNFYDQIQKINEQAKSNYYFITKLLQSKKNILSFEVGSIIDKMRLKLKTNMSEVIGAAKEIENFTKKIYDEKLKQFSVISGIISKQNPLEILKNGYGVIEKSGKKILSKNQLSKNDEIEVTFVDGKVLALVTEVKGEENEIWRGTWKIKQH